MCRTCHKRQFPLAFSHIDVFSKSSSAVASLSLLSRIPYSLPLSPAGLPKHSERLCEVQGHNSRFWELPAELGPHRHLGATSAHFCCGLKRPDLAFHMPVLHSSNQKRCLAMLFLLLCFISLLFADSV